jgi:protein CpxP
MKKLMIIVAILTVGFANAQRGERNLTPEQIASVQSKKMTLALDLDAKQQEKVEKVLFVGAKERQAKKLSKEERSELTNVQKVALREQKLEKQIAMKREMKSILNADQYTKWEKMMAKRSKGKDKGQNNRREKRGSRNN